MQIIKIRNLKLERVWFVLSAFLWNEFVYLGARLVTGNRYHYCLEIEIDHRMPFLPWTVLIYFGCFLLWIGNYLYVSQQEDKFLYRFFCADFLAKAICLLCFLILPTTNSRPVLQNETIWDYLMHFLYWIDEPNNLFPSIHCQFSWMCFIAVRRRSNVKIGYQIFSFAGAIAVCIATMTTKQHVFWDTVSGVLLAEFCYQLTDRIGMTEKYRKVMQPLEKKLKSFIK